ncbi:hypothetical protein E2C01_019436 [Portunus trituberculatus]|uniref:Uncharacterized protein n=1 Tax=Portunus trituberculatus TaxID=210409 RepID=A0A5B7DX76_PORTR|nr:hypothetical protein [Portunus trituberculatus]
MAATLALLSLMQALLGLGNAIPDIPASQGAGVTCPKECPMTLDGGIYDYKTPFYLTPRHSAVKITYVYRTPVGPLIYSYEEVEMGETKLLTNYRKSDILIKYNVSATILYCYGEKIDPDCLSVTTTPTTTTTTTYITITEAVSTITTTTVDELIFEDFQGLEVFLLILSVASVLLWMLVVLKSCLTYCKAMAGLDRRIASDKEHGSDVSTSLLYSLRDALVLDFGLRLCLCVLLPCVCVCAYGLYLTMTRDTQNIFVAFYILGAACLLLHGFFCTKKVNSVIKTMIVAQQRPRPTSHRLSRHYNNRGEDNSVSESIDEVQGCPNHTVVAVLKVCLLLLLLCLCVLIYGFYIVVIKVMR